MSRQGGDAFEALDAGEARALLAAVWDCPGIAVAVFDADGRYVRVNQAHASANNLPPPAHIGRPVRDVAGEQTGPLMLEAVRAVTADGRAWTGIEICVADRVWESAWLPLPAPGRPAQRTSVAVVAVDVTDARAASLGSHVAAPRSAAWTARLLDVAHALNTADGPGGALDEAFAQVAEAVGARWASVGMLHDGILAFGPEVVGSGFVADAVASGTAIWLPGSHAVQQCAPTEQARAAVPIRRHGEVLGVLRLGWDSPQTFTSALQAYAQAAADFAGHALHRLTLLECERGARIAAETAHRTAEQNWRVAEQALVSAEKMRARSADLLRLAQQLSAASTQRQIAELVLTTGLSSLSAVGGGLGLADEDAGVLQILAATGGPNLGTLPLDADAALVRAAVTGQEIITHREDIGRFPAALTWMRDIGSHAALAVPLSDEHRAIGALAVHFPTESIDEEEAEHVRAIAALTGQALGRAFAQERAQVALVELQRALLPRALPSGRQVQVWAGYRAAPRASEIGGDFYDTVPLPGGGSLLLLGDVQGHDLTAAALMAQLRAVMHALALSGEPPAEVLAQADAFLARIEPDRLATALVIEVQPDAGQAICASAGHLPPVLVDRSLAGTGRTHAPPAQASDSPGVLDVPPGLPLGLADPDRDEHLVTLPALSRFVLATDGLIERRSESISLSLQRLAALVQGGVGLSGDSIVEELLAAAPAETGDDAAVIVADVRSTVPAPLRISRTLPARVRSAHLARRWAQAALRTWSVSDDCTQAVVAVVTELAANAARAATKAFTVILQPEDDAVIVGVADDSHRIPHPRNAGTEDVDGRGLAIVTALTSNWWVEERDCGEGKTVWARVPA